MNCCCKQELFIIREFDAPREKVFQAFSNPDILTQFFAPFDLTMHFNHHDYKSGGSFSWCNKKGGQTVCTFNGVIHEMTPPLRIIQTAEFMEMPERGNVILEIIKFEEVLNNKTKVTIHDICPNVFVRDTIIKSGMEKGLVDIFNKLDKILTA
ncbi:MAG: SRPBCC domain-containing protein [bacterium]|nr:SRPBCC domain-containing protein [bacterium]